jgi:uncharacterized membrane protein (UPF0127 family)
MAFETGQVLRQSGSVVFSEAKLAKGFCTRARGLLGRPVLGENEALWFDRCASVHCFGMCYAIDIVHLSEIGEVVKISPQVKPFHWSSARGGAAVIEMAGSAAAKKKIILGQILLFQANLDTSNKNFSLTGVSK